MEQLIGREKETLLLNKYINNSRSEFIAIYGRRRVGKTFLIRKFFSDKFDFYATGIIEGSMAEEMEAFNVALTNYGYTGKKKAKTWIEAFTILAQLLKEKASQKKEPIIVFIDELPCFDTTRSGFIHALDFFWNSQGTWIDNIKFIVCGSATSWMIRNVINNKGGLHNRVTHEIHLRPFNLGQVEEYLKAINFKCSRLSTLQLYSAMGGIPYYLSLLDPEENVPDNIDRLFFSEDAEMRKEYRRLLYSLYKNPEAYISVIDALASCKKGLTRGEIAQKVNMPNNGHLTALLDDLIYCDFIRLYNNGLRQNGGIYQLIDLYTLFYHQFCKKKSTDIHYWRNLIGTPTQNTWYGLSFERVCLCHIQEILHVLHLDTIHTEFYSWRSKTSEKGVQIDIIIDRADGNITLAEVKYSQGDYILNKTEYQKLLNRAEAFRTETKCRKGIQTIIITTFGLVKNEYADIAQRVVTLDDLFILDAK
nr:ATP-binding protein [uncultured Prevotella sp.]